jgi:hypothetical protein
MSIELSPVPYVPDEIILQILSHLDRRALGRCCKVSKTWDKLANADVLWKRIFPEISSFSGPDVKKYILTHAVLLKEVLVQRIQKFFNMVPLNQKGEFTCFFPFNPGCTMRAVLGCVDSDSFPADSLRIPDLKEMCKKPNVKEICIFLRTLEATHVIPKFDNHVRDISIFNFGIPLEKKKVLYTYLYLVLPSAEMGKDDLADRISRVLTTRLDTLEAQTQHQGFIIRFLAVCVLGAGALGNFSRVVF